MDGWLLYSPSERSCVADGDIKYLDLSRQCSGDISFLLGGVGDGKCYISFGRCWTLFERVLAPLMQADNYLEPSSISVTNRLAAQTPESILPAWISRQPFWLATLSHCFFSRRLPRIWEPRMNRKYWRPSFMYIVVLQCHRTHT